MFHPLCVRTVWSVT